MKGRGACTPHCTEAQHCHLQQTPSERGEGGGSRRATLPLSRPSPPLRAHVYYRGIIHTTRLRSNAHQNFQLEPELPPSAGGCSELLPSERNPGASQFPLAPPAPLAKGLPLESGMAPLPPRSGDGACAGPPTNVAPLLLSKRGFRLGMRGRMGSGGGSRVSTGLPAFCSCCSSDGVITRLMTMPKPSIAARMTPPTRALLPAAFRPARMAKIPPVAAPDMMAFQGSSCITTIYNTATVTIIRT